MKKKWIIIGVIALLALFIISGINKIPALQEQVNASWSQVENQYQRRADLVPNLVATVKGYASHENTTLKEVVEARANATKMTLSPEMLNNPAAMQQFEAAQGSLTQALSKLMVVVEKYPDLKANENFRDLQSQLEGTENRIAVARKDYIETVRSYNTTVRTFPGMIWAGIYGAEPKATFAATTANADKAPEVKFD